MRFLSHDFRGPQPAIRVSSKPPLFQNVEIYPSKSSLHGKKTYGTPPFLMVKTCFFNSINHGTPMNAVPGDQCEVEEFLNQSHGDTGVPEEETAFTEGQKQRQFHELRFLRR